MIDILGKRVRVCVLPCNGLMPEPWTGVVEAHTREANGGEHFRVRKDEFEPNGTRIRADLTRRELEVLES